MQEQVKKIIEKAINQQSVLLSFPVDISDGANSSLYGHDGQIDSLTLVSIIVDVEEAIHKDLGISTNLADISDLPSSEAPFSTLGTFSKYVIGKLHQ